MLVETMTIKEIFDELRKDYKELYEKTWLFLESGGVKHLRRPYAKFPAYIRRELKSSRNNRHLSTILFRKRGDVFKMKAQELITTLLQTKEGLAAVSIVHSGTFGKEVLYFYRPHMFKRYKERMGLDLNGIELIKYFNDRNADGFMHDDYKHKEGDIDNDVMITVYDGALFGTLKEEDGCICCTINTFIANDTMQDGYKSKFNKRHDHMVDEVEFFGSISQGYGSDYKKRKLS